MKPNIKRSPVFRILIILYGFSCLSPQLRASFWDTPSCVAPELTTPHATLVLYINGFDDRFSYRYFYVDGRKCYLKKNQYIVISLVPGTHTIGVRQAVNAEVKAEFQAGSVSYYKTVLHEGGFYAEWEIVPVTPEMAVFDSKHLIPAKGESRLFPIQQTKSSQEVSGPPSIGTGNKLAKVPIRISSTPDGADIQVDGVFVGNTPSKIEISSGVHTITISKLGFAPWTRQMSVSGGSPTIAASLTQKSGESTR